MYGDGPLTEQEMYEYNRDKCHNLWSTYTILNDPDLTESQKEQMMAYNRVWGD